MTTKDKKIIEEITGKPFNAELRTLDASDMDKRMRSYVKREDAEAFEQRKTITQHIVTAIVKRIMYKIKMKKNMKITEAIKILKLHNKWRKGDENILMQNPTKIGIAIETLIKYSETKLKQSK